MSGPTALEIALRPVRDSDRDVMFEWMRDPESVHMAAFTPDDPDDRERFDAHLTRILARPDVTHRVITADDRPVGTVACFVLDGETEVTYWVDRDWWGRGIASAALALLLAEVTTRPVRARAASDNLGSLRVLERNGFRVLGTDRGHASARGIEIEEKVLRLD